MRLDARDVTAITGGWVERMGEAVASGVSVDTRTLREGDLFVAIRGPRFDGHAFFREAVGRGAAGLVAGAEGAVPAEVLAAAEAGEGLYIVRVQDTLRALGDLAAARRREFTGKVVAVTGSNGKTTTKEMTAAILGTRWKVARSPGNFNNLVGVPLAVFGLREDHQALVLEEGMNRPAEIARLTDIASPDIGVVTTVAAAHLELLGSVEAVRDAKGELLDRMKPSGTVVLNFDDPLVMSLSPRFGGKVVTFGLRPGADVRAERMVARVDGKTSFDLVAGAARTRVVLAFPGLHNVSNALAAAAASLTLGFSAEEVREGLAACRPLGMRLETVHLPGGRRLVNDAYNANPGSVRAAVDTFTTMASRGRRLVLLGDMLELGEHSSEAHREVGRFMAERGIDLLITVGQAAGEAGEAFKQAAGAGHRTKRAADAQEAAGLLAAELRPGDAVLVKGSRGMALERVVTALDGLLRAAGEGS